MRYKQIMKKCLWIILSVLMTLVVILAGYDAAGNVWTDGEPTFRYYVALFWEILTGIAVFVPVWLLTLLGFARCCLGENWFPFAEKIPIRITKFVLAASAILMVGISVVSAVYLEFSDAPYGVRYGMENGFKVIKTVSAWILFYSILMYVEQWCITRKYSRQDIRKTQRWVTITVFLTWLILFELSCVKLWYTPLERVGDWNTLEDYDLWWFSLYSAVFFLPFWFFSARKTVRLLKNDDHWLTLTAIISKRITVLIALISTGLAVWQLRESCLDRAEIPFFDVPEYLEASATGHMVQAMIWGLVLFYTICLFVKHLQAERRAKCTQ